jgi:hypothetical protein
MLEVRAPREGFHGVLRIDLLDGSARPVERPCFFHCI